MSRRLGRWKSAARQTGVTVEEYAERVTRGEWWCCRCKQWLDEEMYQPGWCVPCFAAYRATRREYERAYNREYKRRQRAALRGAA